MSPERLALEVLFRSDGARAVVDQLMGDSSFLDRPGVESVDGWIRLRTAVSEQAFGAAVDNYLAVCLHIAGYAGVDTPSWSSAWFGITPRQREQISDVLRREAQEEHEGSTAPQRRASFEVLGGYATSSAEVRELVRRAEGEGFDGFFVPDHQDDQLGPFATAGFVAQIAQNLRVGVHVLNMAMRHPGQVAKEAATLNMLSEGRFELGVGAGWNMSDFRWSGIEYLSAPERVARLGEALRIIRESFVSDAVNFKGSWCEAADQPGHVRLTFGPQTNVFVGGGSQRVLELSGMFADTAGLNVRFGRDGDPEWGSLTLERTRKKILHVDRGAAACGRDRPALQLLADTFCVVDHPNERLSDAERKTGLSRSEILASPHFFIGPANALREKVNDIQENIGISRISVPQAALRDAALVMRGW